MENHRSKEISVSIVDIIKLLLYICKYRVQILDLIDRLIDWVIYFNGISIRLG